eukprot:6600246-Ditylum_brightwellii.AAC.1
MVEPCGGDQGCIITTEEEFVPLEKEEEGQQNVSSSSCTVLPSDDGVDNGVDDGDDDGVDDGVDGADKHFTHLSQAVDCHFTQRSEQNKHVVGNKDDDIDDDVDDGVDDSVDDGDDDSVDDGVDGADKHLTHLAQGFDCHFTQRSEGNELVVCKKDDDVDVDDGVDNSVEDGVD